MLDFRSPRPASLWIWMCGVAFLVSCDGNGLGLDGGDDGSDVASAPPVEIETSRLPPVVAGGSYDVELEAEGGSGSGFVWSVTSGRLPPGLDLTGDGRLRGRPTGPGTGTFTVTVRNGDRQASATFSLEVVPNDTGTYNLTLVELDSLPEAFRPHIDDAVDRWEEVLTGDLSTATIPTDFFGSADCGGEGPTVNGTTVDDMVVLVSIDSIDGTGEIIGQAGPCALREAGLPLVGALTLDRDDMEHLAGTDRLTDLIIHEIGHVLGFGALWPRHDLVEGSGDDDPRFTGAEAVEAYHDLGGGGKVPLEVEGGEGTVESHWRESTFDSELMTGFNERRGVPQPLSTVTIGSLADLGYEVDTSAADPYSLPSAEGSVAAAPEDEGGTWDVVLRGPIRILLPDGTGRTVRIPERP